MSEVSLASGASIATLAPGVGGSLARLSLRGHEILRRGPIGLDARSDPRDFSEFPMAPWVNRIAGGRFRWRGCEIDVSRGPKEDPQGLHGTAWRTPWHVIARRDNEASLGLEWRGGEGWPFPFRMVRTFSLTADQLLITASLTNLGPHPMPAASGFHPYFPSDGARLCAATEACWINDTAGIPSHLGLQATVGRMQSGLLIESEAIDNCFTGWDGAATIDWPTHRLALTTEPPLRFLQVYSPSGAGYFCAEPQTAMPDAFNRDVATGGLEVLGAGLNQTVKLRLTLVPRVDG